MRTPLKFPEPSRSVRLFGSAPILDASEHNRMSPSSDATRAEALEVVRRVAVLYGNPNIICCDAANIVEAAMRAQWKQGRATAAAGRKTTIVAVGIATATIILVVGMMVLLAWGNSR